MDQPAARASLPLRARARAWLRARVPRGLGMRMRTAWGRWSGRLRYCTVCGRWSVFGPFGVQPRPDAQCLHCHSLERHRLVWWFFSDWTDLLGPGRRRMLHIAPEPALSRRLEAIPELDHLTADLDSPHARLQMDITKIQFEDRSFDVIFCSHVLEHVADDRRAMRELRRVLRDEGFAVVQVPILRERTFEDPTVTDPAERLRLFGQSDHVRVYGRDFADRLRESGFEVEALPSAEVVGKDNVRPWGIDPGETLFFCTRGPGPALERVRRQRTRTLQSRAPIASRTRQA